MIQTRTFKTLRIDYFSSSRTLEDGNTIKTKYFSGTYEKEITGSVERNLHYIYSPFGLIAVVIKQGTTETVKYFLY
jgi:hypothetical protein